METSQCLGPHEWTYALFPHAGDWSNGVFDAAEALTLPLEVAQAGAHEGTLPKQQRFLEIKGGNIQMTAFKRTEDRDDSYIVRLFNPGDRNVTTTLSCFKDIRRAWLTNLDEERLEALSPSGDSLKLKIAKKKIVTIEFQL
jgi:alpha-mannosidase